jgi:hypothetical protein
LSENAFASGVGTRWLGLPAQILPQLADVELAVSSEGIPDLAFLDWPQARVPRDERLGDQLGRLEARLREVEQRLSLLDACEVEAEWVSRCLADFDRVWDALSSEKRGRLVRAVVERVEVDESAGDVRVFIADLACAAEVTMPIEKVSA